MCLYQGVQKPLQYCLLSSRMGEASQDFSRNACRGCGHCWFGNPDWSVILRRLASAGDASIYHLFCVFDGHNGDEAAIFMANHVPKVRASLCLNIA
jgi:hypothetical protein